jgi:hypothetical protein
MESYSKSVFFGIEPKTFAAYRDDTTILFCDGLWWFLPGKNGRVKRSVSDADICFTEDFDAVVKALRSWTPIFYRWLGRADRYELDIRNSAILILKLITSLRDYEVDRAVFFTGASHHIHTVIFELACVFANVKQVFLYNEAVTRRILPLIQTDGIESRIPAGVNVSDRAGTTDEFNNFLINRLAGSTPVINWNNQHVFNKNYIVSVLWIFLYSIKRQMSHMLRQLTSRNNSHSKWTSVYPLQFFGQIRQQRNALKYYDSYALDSWEHESATSPVLLVFAHFQPEASTVPQGGKITNHIDLVIKLRRIFPGWKIYYKEHPYTYKYYDRIVGPTRVGMCRSVAYYRNLRELGVSFLTSSFPVPLVNVSSVRYLPVTITGTIAIERALAGYRTIVAGYPWFVGMPGTFRLSDFDGKPLTDLALTSPHPDKEIASRARDFLMSLLDHKTIENAIGVGFGGIHFDTKSQERFLEEFDTLVRNV